MDLLKTYIPFYVVDSVSDNPCVYYLQPVLAYPLLPRTGSQEADVTTALNNLFSIKDKTIGRFSNPFSASGHTLVSIDMKDSPLMKITITGWPGRTENACTNHAMRDQIFNTIYSISYSFGINDVVIWQDDFLYDDYMIGG